MNQIINKLFRYDKTVSYEHFISFALYDEEYGYYMKSKPKLGKCFDFVTSPYVSRAFAKTIVRFAVEKWTNSKLPIRFYEIGSGDGTFASAFLNEMASQFPSLYEQLTYISIEHSPYHRYVQYQQLQKHPVIFYSDFNQVFEIEGIVFSNEWLDALPVHVIQQKEGKMWEVAITIKDGQLMETYLPLTNKDILQFLQRYNVKLTEGVRREIPIKMVDTWIKLITNMKQGWILTIDYGTTEEERLCMKKESVRGFYQHQLVENLFQKIGEIDMTYSIWFDCLMTEGKKHGCFVENFTSQKEFLLQYGILNDLLEHSATDPFSPEAKWNRSIVYLIRDGGFSDSFRALVQRKEKSS